VVGEGAAQDREREAKTGERAGEVPGKTGKVGSYTNSSGLLCYDLSVPFLYYVPCYQQSTNMLLLYCLPADVCILLFDGLLARSEHE